jgi:hypothetical protein
VEDPQSFDRQAVVEEAMKLFWERGYEGTSFADLIATWGSALLGVFEQTSVKQTGFDPDAQSCANIQGQKSPAFQNGKCESH